MPSFFFELSKKQNARKENASTSLPLEGKVPSAHTGRMRWKSCILTEIPAFSPFSLTTSSVGCAASFPSRGSL